MTLSALGQHNADKKLNKFLHLKKIDTFIYIKTGCTDCLPNYEDSGKKIDIVTIKLLYKQKGQQYLVSFSDTCLAKNFGQRNSIIFNFIYANRQTLKDKDKFYEESKKELFQAPCLIVYPYEIIDIKIGQFKHRHTLVRRETDDCGTVLTNHDWFKIELEILNLFDKL